MNQIGDRGDHKLPPQALGVFGGVGTVQVAGTLLSILLSHVEEFTSFDVLLE